MIALGLTRSLPLPVLTSSSNQDVTKSSHFLDMAPAGVLHERLRSL